MINIPCDITNYLATARNSALLMSFGRDSTLLSYYARLVNPSITHYYFGDELPEFAAQYIIDHGLTVVSYPPADSYLVPDGDGLALIDEYAVSVSRVPLVSKVTQGDNCTHSQQLHPPMTYFPFPHDLVLWGYRRSDWSEAVGCTFTKEIVIDGICYIAPLYDLTEDQVANALDALNLPYVENDSAVFCNDCLQTVINSDWDRQASLSAFRHRFNFNY